MPTWLIPLAEMSPLRVLHNVQAWKVRNAPVDYQNAPEKPIFSSLRSAEQYRTRVFVFASFRGRFVVHVDLNGFQIIHLIVFRNLEFIELLYALCMLYVVVLFYSSGSTHVVFTLFMWFSKRTSCCTLSRRLFFRSSKPFYVVHCAKFIPFSASRRHAGRPALTHPHTPLGNAWNYVVYEAAMIMISSPVKQ